ncbi:hypothetical protein CPS_3327 [Colwellia psychrerythraea 34H]|uniref:Uncharacterized protein n=1 Tax=Colwellia psychrerythraea (strain 34H / ATCC BAA-681) TaxID=167879 RepID=Q47YW7_COLP3|nr:hypothetical protein CPS_3327 [Colwellia psychrerythraea 34H]
MESMGCSLSYTLWLKAQVPINVAVKENKKRLAKFNVSHRILVNI